MDRRDDILRHFPTLLARWRGSYARLASLTESHPSLSIRLFQEEHPGCLVVSIYPDHIHSPRTWEDADITVSKDPDGDDYIIRDERAGVVRGLDR